MSVGCFLVMGWPQTGQVLCHMIQLLRHAFCDLIVAPRSFCQIHRAVVIPVMSIADRVPTRSFCKLLDLKRTQSTDSEPNCPYAGCAGATSALRLYLATVNH